MVDLNFKLNEKVEEESKEEDLKDKKNVPISVECVDPSPPTKPKVAPVKSEKMSVKPDETPIKAKVEVEAEKEDVTPIKSQFSSPEGKKFDSDLKKVVEFSESEAVFTALWSLFDQSRFFPDLPAFNTSADRLEAY